MSLLLVFRPRHATGIASVLFAGGGGTGMQLEGRALDRYTDKYPYGSNKPPKAY